ncbi:cysteine desulfurase [mine drainage metagenome]|uniref:Cysteine desulfurase n=1 Tax=mine drainage metagenome TaxID=410659 RepID=A0A1J5Q0X1_9ZZZZ
MVNGATAVAERTSRAWAVLDTVADPEVPVLSVCDLGMVRTVDLADDGALDMAACANLITSKTKLVGVTHMSNVLGTVSPVA